MSAYLPQSYKGVRNVENSTIWDLSEKYLDCGRPLTRLDVDEGDIIGHIEPTETSVLFYVLKGLTFIVIVLPIIAYCTREYFRYKHYVTLLKADAYSLTEQKITKYANNPLYSLFTDKCEPSNLNTNVQLERMEQALPSLHNYYEAQTELLYIVRDTIQALITDPQNPNHQHLARSVMKRASAFLRKNTEKRYLSFYVDYLEGGNQWECNGRYPSAYIFDRDTSPELAQPRLEKHVIFCHLLKNLRKLVKLHCKPEKIKMLLRTSPEFFPGDPDVINNILLLLRINWIHGSKAFAVKSALDKTEKKLVPTGQLQRYNIHSLSGANDDGASHLGINQVALSGVGLARAEVAIDRYSSKLKSFSIEDETQRCEYFIRNAPSTDDLLDNYGLFTRKVLAFARLKGADPEKFEAMRGQLKAKIIDFKLAEKEFLSRQYRVHFLACDGNKDHYYSFAKSLKRLEKIAFEPTISKTVSEEDIHLGAIPVAIASNTHLGLPVPVHPYKSGDEEEAFPGTLELGEEVQYLFTEPEHIETVAELVEGYHLAGKVQVLPFELLDLARKAEVYLRGYFNDIYSFKKWKRHQSSSTATLYLGAMEIW